MSNHKKAVKISILAILAVIVILGAFSAWFTFGKPSELKNKVLAKIPYPIALVNGKPVWIKDYLRRYSVSESFYKDNPQFDAASLKNLVYDQLIDETKMKQLASSKGVGVKIAEIDEEFEKINEEYILQDPEGIQGFLDQHGLSQEEFKKDILNSELLIKNLVIWFNTQQNLNGEQYAKVESIKQGLSGNKTFEELVNEYTEDEQGKLTEGDLGFIDMDQVLPEFSSALSSAADGEVRVMASRYGIHVVKVIERDNNGSDGSQRLHIKQIFLAAGNFEDWYKSQIDQYSVKKMVKI